MQKQKILVVEDDNAIRQGVVDGLEMEGYAISEAADGDSGLRAALKEEVDLVLLDLVLPKRGGLEILGEVRAARPDLPVIILTALGQESDRVAGLRLGADDYVVKPFSLKELTARVAAVLRRTPERPTDIGEVIFPGGKVDLDRRMVSFHKGRSGERKIELSQREAELLKYLAGNAGRVVTREELLLRVWHIPTGVETRTIDMHVARLRDKLGDATDEPAILKTVRGKGYLFVTQQT